MAADPISRRTFLKRVAASSGAFAVAAGAVASPAAAAEAEAPAGHQSLNNPTGPLAALALGLGDDLASYTERPRRLP